MSFSTFSSNKPIVIEPMFIDYVHRFDKILINTNNCWSLKDMPPDDYKEQLEIGNTKNWIYRFHDPTTIRTLTFDKEDLEWMVKASQIGSVTRDFSQLFQDELVYTLEKYKDADEWIKQGEWFIRTEGVSLKNGVYGTGPYKNLEMVIKSVVSSNRTHRCFTDTATTVTLYFFPFIKELDHLKEFRVFVYNNEITAISQQSLYNQNPWLTVLHNEGKLETLIRKYILEEFENNIKPKMVGYGSNNYVMDYVLLPRGPNSNKGEYNGYFIEPNSWGANYAAGSSLFGWIQDHDKLYDSSSINFRYTIASNEVVDEYLNLCAELH